MKRLRILLYGNNLHPELDNWLQGHPHLSPYVAEIFKSYDEGTAWSYIRANRINTILIEPRTRDAFNPVDQEAINFTMKVRHEYPHKFAFVFYTNIEDAKKDLLQRYPEFNNFIMTNRDDRVFDSYVKELKWALEKCDSYLFPNTLSMTEASATIPTGSEPASSDNSKHGHVQLPEKVTLSWLIHNVPVQFWVWLGGLILTVLLLGVGIGQTTFIQELVGKDRKTPPSPAISAEELKNRIDQLIQGHNNSIEKLYAAIADEEKEAGKTFYSSDRQPHIDAANRLRETVTQEDGKFQAQIKALKELESK
jgi:hypothetical protein